MSIRSFFTKRRSQERTVFCACGVGLVLYAAVQALRGRLGVAAFLGGSGAALVLVAWLASEERLRFLASAAIAVNVAAAVAALAWSK